jgi:replicative DNA helicase
MTNEPPFSKESEDGVLGSILLDPARIDLIDLKPNDFYDRRNAMLWEVLIAMRSVGKPMDTITIGEHLKANGRLEFIGGYDRITALMDFAVIPAHSQSYSEQVKKLSVARSEIVVLQDGLGVAYGGESASSGVLSALTGLSEVKVGDKDIATHGEAFIDKCKLGDVGHLEWWCPEWTNKLGKLSTEIILLHAPRSTGKTALMLQWIRESHINSQYTPLVSIEMLKEGLAPRFISNIGQVSTFTMRSRGSITFDEERKARGALQEIEGLDLRIREGEASMDDIFKFCIMEWNKLKEEGKALGAIWVDNLLCINDGGVQFKSKTLMYDFFMKKFRELRNILKVPIIVLAHPNAEGGIAWSKDAENIADIILYLQEVPSEGVTLKGSGTFIGQRADVSGKHLIAKFQKSRDGISPIANLDFVGSTQTFCHLDWVE